MKRPQRPRLARLSDQEDTCFRWRLSAPPGRGFTIDRRIPVVNRSAGNLLAGGDARTLMVLLVARPAQPLDGSYRFFETVDPLGASGSPAECIRSGYKRG
jgi:hypothetical protein